MDPAPRISVIIPHLNQAEALAASPLAEVRAIAGSDRLHGPRARALAFLCLARIRLHQARRMLALATRRAPAQAGAYWNRP